MDAREMAQVMMDWHLEDDDEIMTLIVAHFPDEEPAEIHRAVKIVAFEKAEKVRQMEQELGLSGQPPTDG
jgi:hypothetical protein